MCTQERYLSSLDLSFFNWKTDIKSYLAVFLAQDSMGMSGLAARDWEGITIVLVWWHNYYIVAAVIKLMFELH